MEWLREDWQDLLVLTEDWMRSKEYRMIIKVSRISDAAAACGFRIDSVWKNGVICFDLVRLSDEVIVLECVGSMDIERYFEEN